MLDIQNKYYRRGTNTTIVTFKRDNPYLSFDAEFAGDITKLSDVELEKKGKEFLLNQLDPMNYLTQLEARFLKLEEVITEKISTLEMLEDTVLNFSDKEPSGDELEEDEEPLNLDGLELDNFDLSGLGLDELELEDLGGEE